MKLTKRIPVKIIVLTVAAICICSCSERRPNLHPYGWRPVEASFDTLTVRAERIFNKTHDTVQASRIIEAMEEVVKTHPDNPVMVWRTLYWKGKLAMRKGDFDEAFAMMDKALAMVDTSEYEYDRYRIEWNLDLEYHPATIERYNELEQLAGKMKTFGDLPLEADYNMQLGCFLNDIGNYGQGMPYLDIADSLFTLAGMSEQTINNKINRANALNNQGKGEEGARVLRNILADSEVSLKDDAKDLVLGNIYEMVNDTTMLRRAWLHARNNPILRQSRTIYADYLAYEKMKCGEWDSAAYYHGVAAAGMQELDIPISVMEHHRISYLLNEHRNRWDSAFYHLNIYATMADSLYEGESNVEISNIALVRSLAEQRLNAELRHERVQTWLLIAVFSVIIAAGIVGWLVYRHLQRAKLKAATDALAIERSRRKMAAMEVLLEENNTLIDDVDSHISKLVTKGELTPADLSDVRSSLRGYSSSDDERRDFLETFGEIDSEFSERLREAHPSLTDSDIKICIYIALGLDTKHIARIAHIRPESVKQARWRLRSKMGLARDTNLDDEIRKYRK